MTDPTSRRGPESILEEYLGGLGAGDEADVEVVCRRHPEHAGALRRLWAERELEALGGGSIFGPRGPASAGVEPAGQEALGAGDVLGDFRLVHPLGSGGMGHVWEAEQVSLGRRVALKLVRPECVNDRTLDLFAREARAGGRLSHPGIVSLLGYGDAGGVAWIAMELVEGAWTLRDAIDELDSGGELPPGYYAHVARFVASLADALGAAHEAGVIHRDLKPQNVLVTPGDEPKLTDFGLARITDEAALSVTGEVVGTYFYMSPEQVAAQRAGIDHRTDVFSLGVVLYEMLTLQRPFQGDTTHQVAEQILMKDPPSPRLVRSKVPEDLAVICGKCLEKDRDRRYASMREVAADLRRHLADEPIRAKPPTAAQRAVKWARRNPTKSVAAGLVAAAVAVISLLLAENVRARGELERSNVELETSNLALAEKTEEAERLAEERAEQARLAREQRSLAEQKAEDVLRLSAQQDLEDLLAEQAELWPPYPEQVPAYRAWIERAEALVADLPLHETKREELRALALPRTEDERLAEREAHPDFGALAPLAAKLESRRRALAVRRGEREVALPSVARADLPEEPAAWNRIAWGLVRPDRRTHGEEARGLAIALAALDRIGDAGRAPLLDTIAWGRFALGDDEGALEAGRAALEAVPEDDRAALEESLARLNDAVEEARSEGGLAAAASELASIEAELARLDARLDERRDWRFPEGEEQARWWNASLTKLIEGLEALERDLLSPGGVTAEHGWSVPKRLAFAERMQAGFREGGEYDDLWRRALPAIRDAYPGLDLAPQVGLAPLGADPRSGLWEFAHLATGEPAVRGEGGELALTEETGVVLVLIPAGSFWMGAQGEDPDGRNYDPGAQPDEGPVHEVSLSAHFLSKYEMTQAQWQRVAGRNPSNYQPPSGLAPSLLHPVEQVSWFDCVEVLPRIGLGLPSEAQWERGARAGTSTAWWFGQEREDLRGKVNLADKTAADAGAPWTAIQDWPDHEDGGVVHRAVGSYPPNGFGLHEVHGNVWEWCLDGTDSGSYARPRAVDPVADPGASALRVDRGGSFHDTAHNARSARRGFIAPTNAGDLLGVRPARAVRN